MTRPSLNSNAYKSLGSSLSIVTLNKFLSIYSPKVGTKPKWFPDKTAQESILSYLSVYVNFYLDSSISIKVLPSRSSPPNIVPVFPALNLAFTNSYARSGSATYPVARMIDLLFFDK